MSKTIENLTDEVQVITLKYAVKLIEVGPIEKALEVMRDEIKRLEGGDSAEVY